MATWGSVPPPITMLQVPRGMNVSPEPRPAPSGEAAEAFAAYGTPAGTLDPSYITEPEVRVLLSAVADALNACERARITVKLAHGCVLSAAGYVLPVFPDAGERYAVRTMALTEFSPAPSGSDEED